MKAHFVKEAIDFERGGDPMKQLGIGIVTWNKLDRGDILINIKPVVPQFQAKTLRFGPSNFMLDNSRAIDPGKYFVVKEILRREDTLELELIYSAILRHEINISQKIKNGEEVNAQTWFMDGEVKEFEKSFRIMQPKEYEDES